LIPIDSDLSCSNNTGSVYAMCISERMLLAFTWMCAIMLLIYLLVLVSIAASRYHGDLKIWVSDVRTLQVPTVKQISPTPTVVRTKQRANKDVYIPHPPRSQPTQIAQHFAGLSSKYKIEPFRPVFVAPDTSHSNLPEAIPLPLAVTPVIPSSKPFPIPPQDMLGLYDMPRERERVPSSPHLGPRPPVHVPRKQSMSLPTPPPLGDWPRQDIMRQPVKPRKHKLPPSAYEFPGSHAGGSDLPDVSAQPRPRRPSGPRLRLPSGPENGQQLVALDLYPGVSTSYITARRDDVAR